MKVLKRNKKTTYYSLYLGDVEVTKDGMRTGRFEPVRSEPIEFKVNVSATQGHAYVRPFGLWGDFSAIMVTDDMETPFDLNTVFWVDKDPTTEPYNFIVVRVSRSLNSTTIALKEVEVAHANSSQP